MDDVFRAKENIIKSQLHLHNFNFALRILGLGGNYDFQHLILIFYI